MVRSHRSGARTSLLSSGGGLSQQSLHAGVDVSAASIYRICDHERLCPPHQSVEINPEEVVYAEIDGSMILTDNRWREVKPVCIFRTISTMASTLKAPSVVTRSAARSTLCSWETQSCDCDSRTPVLRTCSTSESVRSEAPRSSLNSSSPNRLLNGILKCPPHEELKFSTLPYKKYLDNCDMIYYVSSV